MNEDDLLPINGNCFAYIGLFYLFIDWISYIPFIPAIKNIGFKDYKWNANPAASFNNHNYSFAQLDPERFTRRTFNVHALAGFGILFAIIFQLVFTLYFRRPQQKQQQQKEEDGQENSTTTRNSPFSCLTDNTARYLHRNLGRMLIVLWFFVYISGNVYFVTVITSQDKETVAAVAVFLYSGTISIANVMVGYWAVAMKKDKKDYLLHKICMGFAIISPSGISYGRIVVMILQCYLAAGDSSHHRYGENCLLDQQILFDCFVAGYMLHFLILTMVLYLHDKRFLFQVKAVQWNLLAMFLLSSLLCAVAVVMNLLSSSFTMENMCIDS